MARIVTLTPELIEQIRTHLAQGDFSSVGEALQYLIDAGIVEVSIEDIDQLLPLVDKAIAEAERGDVVSLDEHKARNETKRD